MTRMRAVLDDTSFTRAWETGQSVRLEQALAEALISIERQELKHAHLHFTQEHTRLALASWSTPRRTLPKTHSSTTSKHGSARNCASRVVR